MLMALSDKAKDLQERLQAFMDEVIYPAEATFQEQHAAQSDRWVTPTIMEELKTKARERGLWNLWLPESEFGAGLSNFEYAHLFEEMGRSNLAPEACNCS
ncbi:MAG: acyl-CoA dehydrogenase family protein, partial [Alphaproteobacteria bacterium]